MTQKKYIVSHDVGTGGNKAVICDLNGQVLFSNYLPYSISYPSPEWVEQILSWRHTGFNVHSRVRARTKLEAERALRQRPSGESQEGEQICGR